MNAAKNEHLRLFKVVLFNKRVAKNTWIGLENSW